MMWMEDNWSGLISLSSSDYLTCVNNNNITREYAYTPLILFTADVRLS